MKRSSPSGRLFAIALVGALVSTPLLSDPPPGKGKPNKAEERNDDAGQAFKTHNGADDTLVQVSISASEVRRIAQSYRYTGYAALPPGIRKNLARGKPLPPGIARKAVPAPMLERLPRYPNYEWGIYGNDLVLVAATGIIADVLSDVFD